MGAHLSGVGGREWVGGRDVAMGDGSDCGHRRQVVGHADGTGGDVRSDVNMGMRRTLS